MRWRPGTSAPCYGCTMRRDVGGYAYTWHVYIVHRWNIWLRCDDCKLVRQRKGGWP